MARKVDYLTSSSRRIYSSPNSNPQTSWVYQRTHIQAQPDAPSTATDNTASTAGASAPPDTEPNTGGAFADKYQDTAARLRAETDAANAAGNNAAPMRSPYAPPVFSSSITPIDPFLPNSAANTPAAPPLPKLTGEEGASRAIADSTKRYIGVNKYSYGNWDCSKFTQTIAANVGARIPRSAAAQYAFFKTKRQLVNMAQAKIGDLVFMHSSSSPSGWHVGVYAGNGNMIDNSGTGRPIAVRSLRGRDVLGFGRLTTLVGQFGVAGRTSTRTSAHTFGNTRYTNN